jgi:hypothetical protein
VMLQRPSLLRVMAKMRTLSGTSLTANPTSSDTLRISTEAYLVTHSPTTNACLAFVVVPLSACCTPSAL